MMTVTELLDELSTLEDQGFGDVEIHVVTGDHGRFGITDISPPDPDDLGRPETPKVILDASEWP